MPANKYGFNFLWMYAKTDRTPNPQEPDLAELDFIAEEGFNFVRIPTDYHFWTKGFDYFHPDERILEYIDRYIEACNSRGLHVCFNIHRAPGYCVNWPEHEMHNLWRDPIAEDGFRFIWRTLARRYKGISSDKLSFDLVNEPNDLPPTHPCTREDHARVIRNTVADIRAVDPQREIVIDGFYGGGSALPELADLGRQGVIHSGRGYEPVGVTHYQAAWVRNITNWIMPQYPGETLPGIYSDKDTLRELYKPWREVEAMGVKVHIGEFGCYNRIPNDIALRWFDDILSLFYEYDWGYSLWNFKGDFGIVEHGRPGTVYEDIRGFKVDRQLLELLKKYMRR